MALYGYPALYALFVWWFSTGVIVYLDTRARWTYPYSLALGTLVAGVSLYRLAVSSHDATETGAYAAFTYGVLVWGWHEMVFFMGVLTGPRKTACREGCSGWKHFSHGVQACLDHELAILGTAVAVLWATWGAPNQVGMWTFMALWGMRQSAKLNVFLGVLNLNEDFLPAHLSYLKSFMKRAPMNFLFPASVTIGTAIVAVLIERASAPGISAFRASGLTFLITMLALAVIEHWFLVLPLPFAKLWSWWLRRQDARAPQPIVPHHHADNDAGVPCPARAAA